MSERTERDIVPTLGSYFDPVLAEWLTAAIALGAGAQINELDEIWTRMKDTPMARSPQQAARQVRRVLDEMRGT